jgi:hypothetical protein
MLATMNDVTRILSSIAQGDAQAAEDWLPLDYDELRIQVDRARRNADLVGLSGPTQNQRIRRAVRT